MSLSCGRYRPFAVILSIVLMLGGAASAQQPATLKSGVIDLKADDSIEWLRDRKQYVARGNAVATRDDMTIHADLLVAYYREKPEGGTEIWRYEAHGNVQVDFSGGTLTGDDAAYETASNVFVMTGRQPRLVTDSMQLTATDTIEYWNNEEMMVARGDAVIVQPRRTIYADVVTAHLSGDSGLGDATANAGSSDGGFDRFEAFGGVRIETPAQVLTSEKAFYDPNTGQIVLADRVTIDSDGTKLTGDLAEFDLDTGVGKLSGGGPKRAIGTFDIGN